MPNQLSDKNQRVTVALPKELVAKLDEIARQDERSRSQVIYRLLRDAEAVEKISATIDKLAKVQNKIKELDEQVAVGQQRIEAKRQQIEAKQQNVDTLKVQLKEVEQTGETSKHKSDPEVRAQVLKDIAALKRLEEDQARELA